jgi:hypothetical protein
MIIQINWVGHIKNQKVKTLSQLLENQSRTGNTAEVSLR